MENMRRINKLSLFLLMSIFLSIFSMVALPSFIDVHADEAWREYRMKNIEEALDQNRKNFRNLGHRRAQYLHSRVTNVGTRLERFTVLALDKTQKYNKEMEALDRGMETGYAGWRANRRLAERKDREAWLRSIEFENLLKKTNRRRRELHTAYVDSIRKLKKEILKGEDGVLVSMDQEQERLLRKHEKLLDELKFLKTHTGEEAKARRNRLVGLEFKVFVIGDTERHIDIGETQEVELAISPGTMPLTLKIIAEDGSQEVKTLTRSGRLKLPFQFNIAGNKTRLFVLTDSSMPRKSSTANVMFFVRDPVGSAIQISKTATPSIIDSGDTVKYTYKVTNPGNDPLAGVTVTDDTCTGVNLVPGGDTSNDGKLDPVETWTYECSMPLTSDTTNTATANGTGTGGALVSHQASATVIVKPLPPVIHIAKTAVPSNINSGDTVKYTYKVTNPGSDPLSGVTVTDDTCTRVTPVPGGGHKQ